MIEGYIDAAIRQSQERARILKAKNLLFSSGQ